MKKRLTAAVLALSVILSLSGFSLLSDGPETPKITKKTGYLDSVKIYVKNEDDCDGFTLRLAEDSAY